MMGWALKWSDHFAVLIDSCYAFKMSLRYKGLVFATFVIAALLIFQNCSRLKGNDLGLGGFLAQSATNSGSPFQKSINAMGVSDYGPIFAPARLGIGEPIFENSLKIYNADGSVRWWPWDIDQQIDAMLRLRPAIFRMWVPVGYLFDQYGNPRFFGDGSSSYADVNNLRHIAQRFHQFGTPILGMDHSFPSWMSNVPTMTCSYLAGGVWTSFDANWNAIPPRDLHPGSSYIQFLEKYKNAWASVARLFPEIQSWEPANETNGGLALVPNQAPTGCPKSPGDKVQFSSLDRVLITVDLMAQAKAGIKAGNPAATVFLAPSAPVDSSNGILPSGDLSGIRDFILAVYQNIAAGNSLTGSRSARDYFDGVSWHPYIFQDPTNSNWVDQNNNIYAVLKSFGDGDIPVIFSEVGNSEFNWSPALQKEVNVSPETLSLWMEHTLTLSRANFPWLKYLIWFRGIDSPRSLDWGGEGQRRFGILQEWSAADPTIPFQPKPSAHKFCAFTNCIHSPLSPGLFKAFTVWSGWSLFWFNGAQYCQYSSPELYQRLTGRSFATDITNTRIVDPAEYDFVGACAPPGA